MPTKTDHEGVQAGDAAQATRSAHARREVLTAAAHVLAASPQASIDDVARATGVARATLYRWFENREGLFGAILDQLLAEADAIARAGLAARDTPALSVIQSMAGDLLALGERYRFMEAKLGRDDFGDLHAKFIELIANGQASGELRGDLPAEWVVSMFESTIMAASKEVSIGNFTRVQAEYLMDQTFATLLAPDGGRQARPDAVRDARDVSNSGATP